jgi:Thymosin beta-4 family
MATLKDLPKVADDLKSQLESFSPDSMKNVSTEEKLVLPTAEGKTKKSFNSRIPMLSNIYI